MTASPLRQAAAQAASNGAQEPGTDVAIPGEPRREIANVVAAMVPEIRRALPQHLSADRMARLALTAIRNTPRLAECTPQSFVGSLLTAASLGLEVNTPAGEAYLVPYKDNKRNAVECQLIVGYQGMAKLYWQSPLAKHLDAQAVYANDEFDYAYGLGQYLRHKPARGERGDLVCYYACAELTSGGSAFVVLSPDEVKKLRKGKVGPQGDIDDPQRWMERKTVLRQLLKTLPRSATVNTAISVDEQVGSRLFDDRVDDRRSIVNPATVSQLPAGDAASDDDEGSDEVDVADAELVDPTDDDIDRLPRPSGAAMTKAQQGKLQAQFEELAITGHDGRVAYCFDVVGREISTTSDLTKAEATKVIQAQARQLEEWASKAAES